ncbi:MAG: hypothetical protein PHR51_02705 [Patescibacteria group bacterium]|nr:hypothetical protein [Patescibacteria group bacterium]
MQLKKYSMWQQLPLILLVTAAEMLGIEVWRSVTVRPLAQEPDPRIAWLALQRWALSLLNGHVNLSSMTRLATCLQSPPPRHPSPKKLAKQAVKCLLAAHPHADDNPAVDYRQAVVEHIRGCSVCTLAVIEQLEELICRISGEELFYPHIVRPTAVACGGSVLGIHVAYMLDLEIPQSGSMPLDGTTSTKSEESADPVNFPAGMGFVGPGVDDTPAETETPVTTPASEGNS